MRSLKILSSALCAWLALGGCSVEDNSTPSVPVDASSQGGASGAGPSSGASGGTTVVMMDASGMDDVAPPARDASNEPSGDATPAAGDAGGCPGLFCEDFEADQFDSTKWTCRRLAALARPSRSNSRPAASTPLPV